MRTRPTQPLRNHDLPTRGKARIRHPPTGAAPGPGPRGPDEPQHGNGPMSADCHRAAAIRGNRGPPEDAEPGVFQEPRRAARRGGSAQASGTPAHGFPATGLPATGFPATGFPATGVVARRIPVRGNGRARRTPPCGTTGLRTTSPHLVQVARVQIAHPVRMARWTRARRSASRQTVRTKNDGDRARASRSWTTRGSGPRFRSQPALTSRRGCTPASEPRTCCTTASRTSCSCCRPSERNQPPPPQGSRERDASLPPVLDPSREVVDRMARPPKTCKLHNRVPGCTTSTGASSGERRGKVPGA